MLVSLGRKFVWMAMLCGASLARAQTAPGPAIAENGATVVSVRIVSEDGRVLSEAPKNIPVQAGKTVERAEVADSIRALYRTGNYSDLRAVETAVDGGVRIDFVAHEQMFFNQVVIVGLVSPPSDATAIAAMQLTLGAPYNKAAVEEGVGRLRDTLHDEGLYAAQVSAETVEHPDTHQMDVIVHVKPGKRAHIEEIHLKNGTEYPDGQILGRLKLKAGKEVKSAQIRRGTERIRKFLVKKGHLNARATVRRGDFQTAKNSVSLDVEVTEGPRVRIAVTGVKFSNGDLKKMVPVYQEGAVDADLLEEGKRNIRERLERAGYFDAEVDYTTTSEPAKGAGAKGEEEVITYKVERGDRHKFMGAEIKGNHYFSNDVLRARLQLAKGDIAARPRFSRRLVESDRESMQNLYLSNGFLEAKVDAQVVDNVGGKEGNLQVRFTIVEGKQTRVASLAIDGVHAFKEDYLMGVVGSTPGQPYSDFNVTTDRDNILALYFNEGFPEATFTSNATPVVAGKEAAGAAPKAEQESGGQVPQGDSVKLVYHIVEGPQTRVRKILYSGYQHTRVGVIRRSVNVKEDAPLREGDVVESQRRLYNLGIFNRVTIDRQNPNGTDPDKDIVVLVEEAKRYTLGYGGGFEVQRLASTTNPAAGEVQAAVRGIFEVSKLNLTGRGDSLSLKVRGSTIEDRALLGYSDPNTFANPHFTFQATAYTEKTQDINTFTESRYEGSVQLADQVTPRTSLLYRYTFRKVLVSNLNIPAQEVPLFNAPTLVSQVGITWVRDTRDNPAEATKGTFNSADFGVADTSIGSSASFLRLFYQNSTYYPFKRRFSFARSVRIGILEPYKDTVSLSFPTQTSTPLPQLIPLPERFFAGGGTSLRGFALNQAGPRDAITGFPVGGQALLILNQEVRFPMRLPFIGDALGGALFYDGGNVYSKLSRITLRTSPPTPVFNPANPLQCQFNCTNELNYFAHTVGLGFRYSTPVGPIRIDLGYQLNRPQFVVPIACPSTTPNCPAGSLGFKGTRLPGFQIFFNLGSTF
ncbi:MAG TPA: POTRA domain-containing protein [Candidatus Acidoferrum sp.]|jgi:outer membrane protein assembly factor BamA